MKFLTRATRERLKTCFFCASYDMSDEKCNISVKPHPVLGEVYVVKGDCKDRIRAINENQGPYKKKSFNRRLVYINDSLKPQKKAPKE